jgi:hypothetical protein
MRLSGDSERLGDRRATSLTAAEGGSTRRLRTLTGRGRFSRTVRFSTICPTAFA